MNSRKYLSGILLVAVLLSVVSAGDNRSSRKLLQTDASSTPPAETSMDADMAADMAANTTSTANMTGNATGNATGDNRSRRGTGFGDGRGNGNVPRQACTGTINCKRRMLLQTDTTASMSDTVTTGAETAANNTMAAVTNATEGAMNATMGAVNATNGTEDARSRQGGRGDGWGSEGSRPMEACTGTINCKKRKLMQASDASTEPLVGSAANATMAAVNTTSAEVINATMGAMNATGNVTDDRDRRSCSEGRCGPPKPRTEFGV